MQYYFKTLLNQKVSISAEYQENVSDYLLSHEAMCFDCTLNDPVMLNTEISYKEMQLNLWLQISPQGQTCCKQNFLNAQWI